MALALLGCQPAPRPDVGAQAARLTGVAGAIVIRERGLSTQPAASPARLSLAQAVRLNLENDPRIQTALADVRAAEADAHQARLLPNPILVLDVRAGTGRPAFETELTGDLIAVLQMPQRISAADNRLRAAAADALTTVLDSMTEVQTAYAAAQALDPEVADLRQRGLLYERLLDLARKRLNAGEGTELDVLTLQAQSVQAQLDLAALQLQRLQQRAALARLIGQPRDAAAWRLDAWQPPPPPRGDESAWLAAALANRPEIRSKMWTLAALGADISLANLSPLAGDQIGAHGEHDPSWRVGPTVTVPVPIFDFGQDARAKAKAMWLAALHDLDEQRLMVIQQVRQAYAGYQAALTALDKTRGELLPIQQREQRQAELAYQSGDTDLTTLLLVETSLQETKLKVVQLEEQADAARAALQRAAGGAGVAAGVQAAATQPALATQTGSPQ
jgi:outer membrane protein, heavy metal efflux system